MATTNNPTATPDWLAKAAQGETPGALDRVALTPPSKTTTPSIDVRPISRLGAGALPSPTPASDENDVHRRGYDPAALMPSTIVLGLFTVGVVTILRPFVPGRWSVELVTMPLLALWAGQIFRVGYRLFAYRYRLTSRRLYRERGRLYPREEPLELANVGRVEVRQTRWQLKSGVGDVVVVPEESSGRPVLDLAGVRGPKEFAALIESTTAAAREDAVKAVRSAFPSATR
jgi:hypothetical protein